MTESICLVCQSSRAKDRPYPTQNPLGLHDIRTCESCDFGWALPVKTQAELDAFYASGSYWHSQGGGIYLEAHQQVQAQVRLEKVRSALTSKSSVRVLDIGAGQAFIAEELARYAKDVGAKVEYAAVEPDSEVIGRNRARLKGSQLTINWHQNLESAGGGYDLIFLNHVLEHVTDPVAFLMDLRKRLAPDGKLYVEVPHHDDLYKQDVFPHVLFFSEKALRRVGEMAGLRAHWVEAFGIPRSSHRTFLGKFIARVKQGLWGRVFNLAVQKQWPAVIAISNRVLYGYKPHPNGIWLRAHFSSLAG